MDRTSQGGLSLSAEEASLMRAALFMVKFHLSKGDMTDLHILTGHDYAEFVSLLQDVDLVRERDART
jgi:hypothetical protein